MQSHLPILPPTIVGGHCHVCCGCVLIVERQNGVASHAPYRYQRALPSTAKISHDIQKQQAVGPLTASFWTILRRVSHQVATPVPALINPRTVVDIIWTASRVEVIETVWAVCASASKGRAAGDIAVVIVLPVNSGSERIWRGISTSPVIPRVHKSKYPVCFALMD
jgi:hypothetical protein